MGWRFVGAQACGASSLPKLHCMKIDLALLRASRRSWMDSNVHRAGPYWMRCVWTVLFSAAIAVGFTVLGFLLYTGDSPGAWRNLAGWAEWYGRNFIVSLTIGSLIQLSYDGLGRLMGGLRRVNGWRPWQRTLFFSGIPLACTAVGWPLGVWFNGADVATLVRRMDGNAIAGSLLLSLLLTVIFHQFFAIKARQIKAEQRATEAQLRLLQGQIEPHFLFNTLANVVGLIDADPTRARLMLESFIDYLRSSLGSLRSGQHTLGDEVDLIRAYLSVLQIRMEDRLQFAIDVPTELRALALPPLILQPLVENAVVHGLEPKIEGGTVRLQARQDQGRLLLQVDDDGLGLPAAAHPAPSSRPGSGTALANIRERLQQAFGDDAALRIEPARAATDGHADGPKTGRTSPPAESGRRSSGVRATLSLPVPAVPPPPTASNPLARPTPFAHH
jgi:signal transduction histidine kinase